MVRVLTERRERKWEAIGPGWAGAGCYNESPSGAGDRKLWPGGAHLGSAARERGRHRDHGREEQATDQGEPEGEARRGNPAARGSGVCRAGREACDLPVCFPAGGQVEELGPKRRFTPKPCVSERAQGRCPWETGSACSRVAPAQVAEVV